MAGKNFRESSAGWSVIAVAAAWWAWIVYRAVVSPERLPSQEGVLWILAGLAIGAVLHLAAWWLARPAPGAWWMARSGAHDAALTAVVAAIAADLGRSLTDSLAGDQTGFVGTGVLVGIAVVGHVVPRLPHRERQTGDAV